MKKGLLVSCAVISMCLLVLGGYKLYLYWSESSDSFGTYAEIQEHVRVPETDIVCIRIAPEESGLSVEPSVIDTDQFEESISWPEVDFDALRQINPDIVGWLYCEGTVINYPVTQGRDNSYYLNHLFDGTKNSNGCLFLDCRASDNFSSRHSIIYGHHMKNGSMFTILEQYKKLEFYEDHPIMLLMTPSCNYVVRVHAAYTASVCDNAWVMDFEHESEYYNWIRNAEEKSLFHSGGSISSADRILTLSTCSTEFRNARFVVIGVLEPAERG